MERLTAVLVAAHAIADMLLQSDGMVKRKDQTRFLLLHAATHAVCSYVALQAWTCWQVPLIVLVAHFLIDWAKQDATGDTEAVFVVDQAAHFLSLLGLAWLLVHFSWCSTFSGLGYKPLIAVAGFVATARGSGFLVHRLAKRLIDENDLELDGLLSGGKLIGQLERSLIFLFIMIGHPAGIGFLVAAKSILRFEGTKDQKRAEYVLIGTLFSFCLAIALASATKWALGL